jgi:hypothetical protein
MLLQTNSYLVPRDRIRAHDDLMRRFRSCFSRLGLETQQFEVLRETGPEFSTPRTSAVRHVQVVRFRDKDQYDLIHDAEAADPEAQELVAEFARLVELEAQQRRGHFVGTYYVQSDLSAKPQPTLPAHEPTPPAHEPADSPATDEV